MLLYTFKSLEMIAALPCSETTFPVTQYVMVTVLPIQLGGKSCGTLRIGNWVVGRGTAPTLERNVPGKMPWGKVDAQYSAKRPVMRKVKRVLREII
ncbi:uncharacterized protein VTP21DRAFT_9348 [Calcarisporiella thermophila]|uniref:uncharacterized protein n=1 Tax=Calcarisporiella thermophila TaxID=911321 RepID=UPI003742EC46